jgi:macrolide transport system ATP-binding/permease protein
MTTATIPVTPTILATQKTPLIELVNIGKYYGKDSNDDEQQNADATTTEPKAIQSKGTQSKANHSKVSQPKVTVLNNISLKIYAGEFIAIIGTSGSGKSTLMNILGCLDRPTSGQYNFSGLNVADFTSDQLAWLRRKAFGFIFQSYHLIPSESATENVEVPALYAGLPETERKERAQQLLTRLGLSERFDYRPNQLSGGQQQRVSIARALMNGGNIILADEPTGALDTATGIEVMALLKELANAGHTIILITHDQNVAKQAHRIIELNDGKIIRDYTPAVTQKNKEHSENLDDKTAILPSTLSLEKNLNNNLINALNDKKIGESNSSLLAGLQDATRAATRVMLSNLFRTTLTLLGIIIGVASVIIMLSIAEGTKQQIKNDMGAFGNSLMYLNGKSPTPLDPIGDITLHDITILKTLPEVDFIGPSLGMDKLLRYNNKNMQSYTRGSAITFPLLNKWPVGKGRFFTESEFDRAAAVVVIGQSIQKKLFAEKEEAIGKFILIGKSPFQIIGIFKKRDNDGDRDKNNQAVVPYTTAIARLFGPSKLEYISIAVNENYPFEHTEQVLRNTMLSLHRGVEDFEIHNNAATMQARSEIMAQMSLLLGAIAGISLLVGGIGVMNVMLMTVRERTREIGIRMATGARQQDIMRQFLTESVLLSIVGGAVGIILSLSLLGIAVLINDKIPIAISSTVIVSAFSCAIITGIIFGYMPARKAAQLDPVTALADE